MSGYRYNERNIGNYSINGITKRRKQIINPTLLMSSIEEDALKTYRICRQMVTKGYCDIGLQNTILIQEWIKNKIATIETIEIKNVPTAISVRDVIKLNIKKRKAINLVSELLKTHYRLERFLLH